MSSSDPIVERFQGILPALATPVNESEEFAPRLPNGKIHMVDYSNRGDAPPQSHLYAALFSVEDFHSGPQK